MTLAQTNPETVLYILREERIHPEDRIAICCKPGIFSERDMILLTVKWVRRAFDLLPDAHVDARHACNVAEDFALRQAEKEDCEEAVRAAAMLARDAKTLGEDYIYTAAELVPQFKYATVSYYVALGFGRAKKDPKETVVERLRQIEDMIELLNKLKTN